MLHELDPVDSGKYVPPRFVRSLDSSFLNRRNGNVNSSSRVRFKVISELCVRSRINISPMAWHNCNLKKWCNMKGNATENIKENYEIVFSPVIDRVFKVL